MSDITTIIVAKDNPQYIFRSVASVEKISQEIIIVDIGMDKEVVNKLKEVKNLRVIEIKKDVPYVEVIREETKSYAQTPYLIFLDPDEIVPESLARRISSEYKRYDYISIPRKNIIFGKWIQHSRWWPDHQIRVFKKDSVIWKKILHSQPEMKGDGLRLEDKQEYALVHHNYENVSEFVFKMMRYAKSEAEEKTGSDYKLANALKDGLSEFISRYFAGNGYRDGLHGFILAFFQMLYYFLVYVFI